MIDDQDPSEPPARKRLVRARKLSDSPTAQELAASASQDEPGGLGGLLSKAGERPAIHKYQRHSKYRDIIPKALRIGSTNIFSGPSRGGKSTLLSQVIALLLKGEDIFGVSCRKPTCIVYVSLDHPWQFYQDTFDAHHISEEDLVHYATCNDDKAEVASALHDIVEKKGTYSAMEFLMKKAFPALEVPPEDTLVIIDPIHPLTGKDINDYSKVQRSLTGITQYCQHRQVAVLGVAHTAKIQGDPKKGYVRRLDRAAGSTALVGYSATVFSLGIPEESPARNGEIGKVYTWDWNPRGAPPREFKLVRDEETELGFFKLMPEGAESADQEVANELARAMQRTLVYMTAEERITTAALVEFAQRDDVPRRTVERDLKTLYCGGVIQQVKKGLWLRPEVEKGN